MILDHSDDKQVNDLFEKVKKDSKGQLDILVNNAYAGVDMIFSHSKNKFYELDPVEQWDTINGDWSWVEESFSMFYLCFKVHTTYSHGQELFYKFVSKISKELVKQS